MICKTYNAHNCWYVNAFSPLKFSTMIPFNTRMMLWFEKKYGLIKNRFEPDMDWEELCRDAFHFPERRKPSGCPDPDPLLSYILPFKKCLTSEFLFLPPYRKPENINHFELLSFRLGFPGVYLAITDTCWAFAVKTNIKKSCLDLIRNEYYPSIEHKDGLYSFNSIMKEYNPFSETGEQWILINRANLNLIKSITLFDPAGKVRRLPSSAEILEILGTTKPDLVA